MAVPPEVEEVDVAPLVVAEANMSPPVNALAAKAAHADRLRNPENLITLPCSLVAPVTARTPPSFTPVSEDSVNVT